MNRERRLPILRVAETGTEFEPYLLEDQDGDSPEVTLAEIEAIHRRLG